MLTSLKAHEDGTDGAANFERALVLDRLIGLNFASMEEFGLGTCIASLARG